MLSKISGLGWWAALATAAVLGSALAIQSVRLADSRADVAKCEKDAETARANRGAAALADSEKTATKEHAHAADQQAASDRHAQAALDIQPDLQRRLADAERLRHDAESRAARYRAQADGDAAARGRLAHRAEQLDRSLAEGRSLAEELRGSLKQRDEDVALLIGIIRADRRLLTPE